jgi:DNA-binding transcriptional LysR family regulator
MIDIRLKVFKSVATNLSFTKASQELFISQPAISKHIQELEREFNTRLFDRLGNKIQLTSAGKLLLDHSVRILKDYQRLDFDMNAMQQQFRGELRIGASTTISQYVMPEILAAFLKAYPQIKVTMLSGNSRDIETALSTNRIDIGMVEGIKNQPQMKYIPFMRDELIAIVRKENPLAEKGEITVEELRAAANRIARTGFRYARCHREISPSARLQHFRPEHLHVFRQYRRHQKLCRTFR